MYDDLRITDKGTYLLFEFTGTFSVHAGLQTVDVMLQESVARGHRNILLDCSKMTGDLKVLDKFEVADYGQKLHPIRKMAMVISEDKAEPDDFVQNVARNRGVNLTVFTDFDAAVQWLNE